MNTLVKAKSALILDQPFFASLLCSMPLIEDKGIPTLCTNGDEIRFNPDFLAPLTLQETVFVLAHEVLHCALQHMYRRGTRDPQKWNVAADYVINDTLIREKIGTPIKGALINSALVSQGGGTSEGVYGLLPDSPQGGGKGGKGGGQSGGYPGPGEDGGALDEVQDGGADEAEQAQKEAEMRVKVIQAANAAKMCGKLSAGMERLVGEASKSRVDWKSVLRRFLTERAKTEYTYARPKRRFLADDINLPSLTGEKMGGIVVAVDCSGSIYGAPEVLDAFAAEIKSIIADISPEVTHVVYFDSQVLRRDSFGPDDAVEVKPIGGGGTAFSPIFKHIAEQDLNPVACVVLTDLYCDDFGPAPEYPVLWATYGAESAPFGEVLKIKAAE